MLASDTKDDRDIVHHLWDVDGVWACCDRVNTLGTPLEELFQQLPVVTPLSVAFWQYQQLWQHQGPLVERNNRIPM